jgi:DNA-binding response OmpR family regulator
MISAWKRILQSEMSKEDPLGGIIESGDFSINLIGRSTTLRGVPLDLSAEEFDVLVFLASHPRNLITPRTMLATNWPSRRIRQTGFLRALISLRAKLNALAAPGKQYLRTEPWVAYRFDPGPVPAP